MCRLFFKSVLVFLVLPLMELEAQVNIINISLQPFNVTPEALLNVNIMNSAEETQVQILTQLYNSSDGVLLTVKSQLFKLSQGLNSVGTGNRSIASAEFASVSQSSYLKNTHTLPSGRYKVCCSVLTIDGKKVDDFCEDIESEFNQFLYLINPFDGDTIDSRYPILSWTHNEPFSILNQGESFRLVVTEIKENQSPEAAVTVNAPVMVKYPIQEHQMQYPYDAPELKPASQYAWQVQKLANGVVVNKTEAWKFNVRTPEELVASKFVALKDQVDGSFYTANNGIVYFKFFEEYKSQGQLSYRLTNDKREVIDLQIKSEEAGGNGGKSHAGSANKLKVHGNNLFSINLNTKSLNSGFYTLEVKNEKNESYYLKIFLP